MSNWDDIDMIAPEKAAILVDIFKYAVEHGTDTVEFQIEMNNGAKIQAKVVFEVLEEDDI